MLPACFFSVFGMLSALGHIVAPAWCQSPSVEAACNTVLLSSTMHVHMHGRGEQRHMHDTAL